LPSVGGAWDCERIVVRALAGNDQRKSNTSRGPVVCQNQVVNKAQAVHNSQNQEGGHLEIQAVLGGSLDTMTRYRSALKRDFYRAIEMLHTVQAERREGEK
jgi:hypothetical protein